MSNAVSTAATTAAAAAAGIQQCPHGLRAFNLGLQQTDQRRSEAAWDDTWRIQMKCAFPGHDSYALLFLFAEGICRRMKTC